MLAYVYKTTNLSSSFLYQTHLIFQLTFNLFNK
jgi:hypothetical protein